MAANVVYYMSVANPKAKPILQKDNCAASVIG